jgi:hypothetical protein
MCIGIHYLRQIESCRHSGSITWRVLLYCVSGDPREEILDSTSVLVFGSPLRHRHRLYILMNAITINRRFLRN